MDFRRKIDHVVAAVREGRAAGHKCSVLIGAGCSVSAGVPTAAGFVEIIRKEHPLAYERADRKTYAKCMTELACGFRRDLIARYVDKARINWAHIALAQLMTNGYIDRVLTTNFDPLVVRACALQGVFPAVYDFAASQHFKPAYIPEPAVFHLHGQHTGFVLMNTEEECERHAKLLEPVFEDAGRGRLWLVVGYSGDNDPVFEHLAGVPQFDYELYWIGYKDDEPSKHVRERLLQPDKYAFHVDGHDADSFFVRLAQLLDCFPPAFVEKPFSHLLNVLEPITPYKLPGQDGEIDVLDAPRKMIARAADQHEGGGPEDQSVPLTDLARSERLVKSLLLRGELDKVVEWAAKLPQPWSEALSKNVAWAYIAQGIALADQAKLKEGADAERLFATAWEKYKAALTIKPDIHEALNNWGNALADQAKLKEGADAERLFAAAYEKYEAALAIKPDDREMLYNWGVALADQAKLKEGAEAERLFGAAYEKFEAALAIKPDMHEALNNWGNALADQARLKEGADADRLFAAACKKYEAALAVKPDKHEALNNWGFALAAQARLKEGAEADRLFAGAYGKYEAALAVKPDMHKALNNWGNALADQARLKEGADADRLFAGACGKYEAALAVKPDMPEALNNWGIALAAQARLKEGAEADGLFAAACEKYEAALAVKPDMHEPLYNWGSALSEWGKLTKGERQARLFEQARDKLLAGEAIQTGAASYNLACLSALTDQPDECRRWLESARLHDDLPSQEHLEKDSDLDSVRECDWFKDLLAGA